MLRLPVKVIPGAARRGIAGWMGDRLKIRVTEPPEKGKANAAVVELLAEALGVPRARVRIVSGTASPLKLVEVDVPDPRAALDLLPPPGLTNDRREVESRLMKSGRRKRP